MASEEVYFGNYAGCLAGIGALSLSYVVLKLLYSIWNGTKAFVLARMLGLGINLKKMGSWAVVTGSTDGIGKAYAEQLAKLGLNIVLISRSPEKLATTAEEIESRYGVKTKTITADFSADETIYGKIQDGLRGLEIGVLVNNVGMGYDHPDFFTHLTDKKVMDLMKINIISLTMMTKIVLPSMEERKKGVIINLSSASGELPTPLLTVYSAAKAYIDYFSRALHAEYKNKGIYIQSVLPHFVTTKLSKIRRTTLTVPDPSSYVRAALATAGVQQRTSGYWVHALESWVQSLLPESLYETVALSVLHSTRKRALKKLEQKQS